MSRRILLADDSVTIQKVIELTFMDADFEVRAVSSGDDAVALFDEVDPDLVIADVHMPGANGYEVAKRSKARRAGVPVLLLVGTFEPFDEAQAKAAGANRHLKKPFDSQELLQIVEELLDSASSAQPTVSDLPPWREATEPAITAIPTPTPTAFAAPSFEAPPTFAEPTFAASVFDDAPATSNAATAEPIWSNFEIDADAAEANALPPLDEGDLGLRVTPEPMLDLPAEEVPIFALDLDDEEVAPEPLSVWSAPAAPVAAATPIWNPEPAAPTWVASVPAATARIPEPDDSLFAPDAPEPVAPAPVFAAPIAAPIVAPIAAPMTSGQQAELSDADVDRIARRIVELIGDKAVRAVAWEVVPDLAEVAIQDRIRELEAEVN